MPPDGFEPEVSAARRPRDKGSQQENHVTKTSYTQSGLGHPPVPPNLILTAHLLQASMSTIQIA
jgi:hypothetical protein